MSQFITEDNYRLHAEMVDKGYAFHRGERYEHFVDKDNAYQAYPVGYIRGPHYEANGNPNPHSCSVQGENGWHQRSFKTRAETIDWAIAKQKEILNE